MAGVCVLRSGFCSGAWGAAGQAGPGHPVSMWWPWCCVRPAAERCHLHANTDTLTGVFVSHVLLQAVRQGCVLWRSLRQRCPTLLTLRAGVPATPVCTSSWWLTTWSCPSGGRAQQTCWVHSQQQVCVCCYFIWGVCMVRGQAVSKCAVFDMPDCVMCTLQQFHMLWHAEA